MMNDEWRKKKSGLVRHSVARAEACGSWYGHSSIRHSSYVIRNFKYTTRHSSRAFTLLEVMLAISLMLMLMAVLYRFYDQSMANRQRGLTSLREAQLARVLLKQITDELRGATGFVPGYGPGVIGTNGEIALQTQLLPDREVMETRPVDVEPLPAQADVRQVRYFIAWDEDITDDEGNPIALGLVRQELKTLRQAVAVTGEAAGLEESTFDSSFSTTDELDTEAQESFKLQLYAPEIKYIEFRYYDGAQWYRDWQITQGNALPQMVRVTIGYEPVPPDEMEQALEDDLFEFEDEEELLPPRSFTAYVRLVQADSFFGSRITRAAVDFAESSGL
ncbi:MAG: hypothetical protein HJJLKODD_00518 [Phycisphaerae bacterium]|nr:hypothetical protein [Phycisphaerae bacterium]